MMNMKLNGLHETVEKSYKKQLLSSISIHSMKFLTIEALDMMRCRPENTGIYLALRL